MISIFSVVNEVAVVGTTCVVVALHTLWYAIPIPSSDEKEGVLNSPKCSAVSIAITFLGYLFVIGSIAYALSFAPILKLTTLQIGGALALFAIAAQVLSCTAHNRPVLSFINNAGFMLVCSIGSAYILHYWPW